MEPTISQYHYERRRPESSVERRQTPPSSAHRRLAPRTRRYVHARAVACHRVRRGAGRARRCPRDQLGIPVVVVKTAAATNVGAYGTPVDGITGTSDVTFDDDVEPYDDYDFIFEVTTGGNGRHQRKLPRYSLDGGASQPDHRARDRQQRHRFRQHQAGFGAGTLVTGDTIPFARRLPWDDTSCSRP